MTWGDGYASPDVRDYDREIRWVAATFAGTCLGGVVWAAVYQGHAAGESPWPAILGISCVALPLGAAIAWLASDGRIRSSGVALVIAVLFGWLLASARIPLTLLGALLFVVN